MTLRLIALVFLSLALVMGLWLGWSWSFGEMLTTVNANAVYSLHDFVRRVFWAGAWDALVSPIFSMPAWLAPAGLALVCFAAAALRPGKG